MAEWYKKIPNWLTGLRLLLIPVFVVALNDQHQASLNFAAVIFVLAAITDYADGIIARKYSAISDFGKLLDPLADKILVMAALVMLTALHDERGLSFVPAWMVTVVLAREFWITGIRAIAAKEGTVMAAKSGGKVKSFLQMVAIVLLLLHDNWVQVFGIRVTAQYLGLNVLLLSIFFSYVSAIDYSLAVFAPQRNGLAGLAKSVTDSVLASGEEGEGPPNGMIPTESGPATDEGVSPQAPSDDSSHPNKADTAK
jgi:CDP-diacylglycerol--glycerol-3-phosphate 3-phosphatidyltransferase